MNRLFWGLLFVLLDYKLTVGRAVFEILPDFAGWFLVMRGMESLAGKSRAFDRGRHWAFVMCIVSAIVWGADLMSPATMTKVVFWAIGLAVLAVTLGLLHAVARGLKEMDRNTERLQAMTLILAVLLPLCHLAGWIPLVGSVCAVAAAVISGLYLLVLFVTMRKSAE